MDYTEQKLRRVNHYEGIVVDVSMDYIRMADGSVGFREVVEHSGGVCVLPVDEQGVVCCVRQFRYPMREHLLEAPAGKLERGEEPASCAVRELSEETGYTAGELIPLGSYYTSPGYSTECLHLYLAVDLHGGQAHLDEGEFLDLVRLPFTELYEMAIRGELRDGKTAIAVLQARKHLKDRGVI